jgi:conjugative coupling factor TraD (TOL family)
MAEDQIEALLRPPTEFYAAVTAGSLATLALNMPGALMLTSGALTYTASGVFFALSAYDAHQGWRIFQYQQGLRKLPFFLMGSKDVPVSQKELYVGKGFRWDQRHTQRLLDARQPENAHYTGTTKLYNRARKLERLFEKQTFVTWLLKHTTRNSAWWNPVAPLPPVGGSSLFHAVGMWEGEEDIFTDLSERVGHTLVLGTTRVGKTRFAEIMIEQDIRRGDVTIVFDPKGDADLMRRVYGTAKDCGRKCYIFHLGYPDISARYNAVGSFSRITEVATRISNQLPSEGNSAAFKEFAWRFVNIIARALYSLGVKPNYTHIRRYINNIEPLLKEYAVITLDKIAPSNWQKSVRSIHIDEKKQTFAQRGKDEYALQLVQYITENNIYDTVLEGLVSAWSYDKTYFDKIVSSVGPLMEKLTTGKVAELLSPNYDDVDDKRDLLDWRNVIREEAVVYVGLDALSDAVVGSAVGNSMFSDLTSLAGQMYKSGRYQGIEVDTSASPKVSIHADEFNELVGDEFVPLLNKAGGAGYQVTVYTQTWSDVEARIGSAPKAGQIAGNLNTMFMLRVKERATAEMLTEQVEQVWVNNIMSVSGANDSSDPTSEVDFTSKNEDRITKVQTPMIEPGDLLKLPKGQAFAVIDGGNLYKLRMPMPDITQDYHLPKDLAEMAESMRSTYATADNMWTDKDWYTQAAMRAGDAIFDNPDWHTETA